jgi:hypothetical protein
MPRSGTTLIEQILASHPDVRAGGEIQSLGIYANELRQQFKLASDYPEVINELTQDDVSELARNYWEANKIVPDSQEYVTDKMPYNFLHLGLISMLFPGSHILHCCRNPLDTCFSLYARNINVKHSYKNDLRSLGQYYCEYTSLMSHWKKTLNMAVFDVNYEEIINNSKETIHNMLEFCGLDMSEKCLGFYNNPRIADSPSYHQVRKPLYADSIGRATHFNSYLSELRDALACR